MRLLNPTPWLLVVLMALACSTPRVQTKVRPGVDLSSYSRIHVASPPSAESAPRSYSAEIGAAMERQARNVLGRRGYEMTSAGQADLELQMRVSEQVVPRRVWASDPDANYYVTKNTTEAVLTVELREESDSEAVWRGEARNRLPERELIGGPSPETIWMDSLIEILEELPRR